MTDKPLKTCPTCGMTNRDEVDSPEFHTHIDHILASAGLPKKQHLKIDNRFQGEPLPGTPKKGT